MLSKFVKALPRLSTLARQSRATFASTGSKDVSAQAKPTGVARRDRLQFSKDRLTDFGDLPLGEVPEALKYDRATETSRLSNGVRVATQTWPGQLATISVFVKAGSRNETLETSGSSHFLQHLAFLGKQDRATGLENLGATLSSHSTREVTSYSLTVAKGDAGRAAEILGSAISNNNFDKSLIEGEREAVYRRCIDLQRDQLESTIEAAHYTSYRDHMLGQPLLGIRENINNLTADNLAEFHRANYTASNIVVVATGDISHAQATELAEKHFGGIAGGASTEIKAQDKPYFTPSVMYMRDDEMVNINVGSFFVAPTWTHEDFYPFQLFTRILGEYRQDKHTGQHLNAVERQYNSMHTLLGNMADVTIHKTFYFPYSDTAIWGSYLHGNEVQGYSMLYASQLVASDWAIGLSHHEVVRAKNRYYNELLQRETGAEIATDIGNQILYLNRPVSRSEIATRIANLDVGHLSRVARHWLFDVELSAVAWGPIHELMALSHYNRPLRRTTLGWYGDYHLHV